jgi:prophage maintenance system killer protein
MPKFIGVEATFAIHHDQISTFGGLHGVRDQGLLESALGQAQQTCCLHHGPLSWRAISASLLLAPVIK